MRAEDKQQEGKGKEDALERKINTEVKEEGVGERKCLSTHLVHS